MRIGLGLPNQVADLDPSTIPTIARQAEEAGFASLGTVGRLAFPGVMDTVALAAAAGATRRVELLPTLLLGTIWPPVLLAKELAGIDGVSGGRLTAGIGLGGRDEDYTTQGRSTGGRGARLDADLETYHRVWRGEQLNGDEPFVPAGTREVPLLFGGFAPAAMRRMARWGQGYISGSGPAQMVAPSIESARQAWSEAGREGGPRVVAINYVSLRDPDRGRAAVHHYYRSMGEEMAGAVVSGVNTTADALRSTIAAFDDLGVETLILHPATDDLDEITAVAEIAL